MSFADVMLFKVHDDLSVADRGMLPAKLKAHYQVVGVRLSAYLSSDQRFPRPGRDGYFDRVKATLPYMPFAGGDGKTPAIACDTWNYHALPQAKPQVVRTPCLNVTGDSNSSSATVLTYWDGHGNAELIRLMMAVCGETWEDKVALDNGGATHMSSYQQLQKMMAAGILMAD